MDSYTMKEHHEVAIHDTSRRREVVFEDGISVFVMAYNNSDAMRKAKELRVNTNKSIRVYEVI